MVCQHSTDPARWSFRRHTAGRRRYASLAVNLPYIKLVILLSFLPLATQRHFPFSLCCFLLYCNSALEGIPSLLPDLPLASFRTHQEENQTKKRRRTYEKEKIFFLAKWLQSKRQLLACRRPHSTAAIIVGTGAENTARLMLFRKHSTTNAV